MSGPLKGVQRARFDRRGVGSVRDHVSGRSGRRRAQDRADRRRQRAPQPRDHRQGRRILRPVHFVQPRQAFAVDRREERCRPRGAGKAGRRRRTCWYRISAPAPWSGLGSAPTSFAPASSAPDLRLDQRRRRDRALREEAGLRSDHPGPFRFLRYPVATGHQPPADDPHHRLPTRPPRSSPHRRCRRRSTPAKRPGRATTSRVAMLDVMISYLWPEGMMQYTVVGAEAACCRSQRPARPRVQDQ